MQISDDVAVRVELPGAGPRQNRTVAWSMGTKGTHAGRLGVSTCKFISLLFLFVCFVVSTAKCVWKWFM